MNWMNVSLSNSQRGTVTYSRPSEFDIGGGVSSLEYMEHPQETELRRLCEQVKVRSATHTSFSVLAMAVTIALGVLFILSDFVARRVVFFSSAARDMATTNISNGLIARHFSFSAWQLRAPELGRGEGRKMTCQLW